MINFIKQIAGMFSTDISIDLGTANTLIYMKGKGIVLDEPSVVVIRDDGGPNKRVEAVGIEAKNMLGRTPTGLKAIRPLKDGVISDFTICEKMLQHFIKKVHKSAWFRPSPRVLICVPCGATQVERRAIRESASGAGARVVHLIDEPMAAAVGAGMPLDEARGYMVCDIGGDTFSDALIGYVRRNYGCVIGDPTAEKIKHEIGSAYPSSDLLEIEVKGTNLAAGVPQSFTINSNETLEALQESLQGIVSAVKTALENTPPELGADIHERGMVLTGGGALLKDLDLLIKEETGMNVVVAEDPLSCVARGGGKVLEIIDEKGVEFLSMD